MEGAWREEEKYERRTGEAERVGWMMERGHRRGGRRRVKSVMVTGKKESKRWRGGGEGGEGYKMR